MALVVVACLGLALDQLPELLGKTAEPFDLPFTSFRIDSDEPVAVGVDGEVVRRRPI